MKIILLSGGSGKRLWPLSNNVRSKQFLKLLPGPEGKGSESMIQRVIRQINESGIADSITIATGDSQLDQIRNQLGEKVNVVTEPSRRDTFPAIALACKFLTETGTSLDEAVVIMPCDVFTEAGYFKTISKMGKAIEDGIANLVLMGIKPTSPSPRFGYIVPASDQRSDSEIYNVKEFTEKPDIKRAKKLIENKAVWNGGVFAFRLGYLMDIVKQYAPNSSFSELRENFEVLPKISFDYEVVEKAQSVAMITYKGIWKDLGTWDTLSEELSDRIIGNVILSPDTDSTHVINEFKIPIVCAGTKNLIIAASPDGILIADKSHGDKIKEYVSEIDLPPMYEERKWGSSQILSMFTLIENNGYSITKSLSINKDGIIEYSPNQKRKTTLTIVEGEVKVCQNCNEYSAYSGDVITIENGGLSINALLPTTIIEVSILR